jgi:hypothetical protein
MEKLDNASQTYLLMFKYGFPILFFLLIPTSLYWVKIPRLLYRDLSFLILILTIISFILSTRLQQGGHNFFHEPISFIGRYSINGTKNYSGYIVFLISTLLFGIFALLLGNLLILMNPTYIYVQITAWIAGISGFTVIMVGLFPIDLFRNLHLRYALLWNISFAILNTFCMLFIIRSRFKVYGYLIFVFVHYFFALCYWYAYIHHKRASMFQKLWFFSMVFGLYGYINFFSLYL